MLNSMKKLPDNVNLHKDFPPVYDQSNLGCSAACAVTALIKYKKQQHGMRIKPAKLFQYYQAKEIKNS